MYNNYTYIVQISYFVLYNTICMGGILRRIDTIEREIELNDGGVYEIVS